MLFSLLSKTAFIILFVNGIGLTQAVAQDAKTPAIVKGVFWFDKDSGAEVYLFPNKTGRGYRLTVVSEKEVKVTYHTRINSFEPVDKDLTAETFGSVRYFEFEHHFSRTTIWMTLEFTIDGRKIPALTKTFYDNIFETVETENFYNPLKTKKN